MAFQLKITLQGARPPIWRRVLVPDTIRMDALHTVIQIAMGWTDSHLHSFTKGGNCWTVPDPEDDAVSLDLDERKFRLNEVFEKTGESLVYVYDFGLDWRHKVTLEKRLPNKILLPTCLAGKGECPMEDGGAFDDVFEDDFDFGAVEGFTVEAAAALLEEEQWPPGSMC